MASTRFKHMGKYAADMAVYTRAMSTDNSRSCSRLKRNLIRALQEDVTPRQKEVLVLYYAQKMTMGEIGHRLGVDKSTVSRTLKRGEIRLERCLRYGAKTLLQTVEDF